MRVIRPLVLGLGAGVVATAAMSVLMLAANRAGLTGKTPPAKITERMLDKLHLPKPKEATRALAAGAHLGYGMAFGALYGLLKERLDLRYRVSGGVAFGTLLWAVSYFGWVPAARILPPPTRDRPGRQATMLAAHFVYGGVLGALMPRTTPHSAQSA